MRDFYTARMERYAASAADLHAAFFDSLTPAVRLSVETLMRADSGDLYVVGGALRDLLLGRPVTDIDLACEGDAIERMAKAFPNDRVTTHARFRTATLDVDGTRIDLATCRAERYADPGALPDVQPAGIEVDLTRRDFTINAMALRLAGAPEIIDPSGGLASLVACEIKVLHDRSFEDDPTRILRAFRYAARLGFTIEHHTARLLRDAIGALATVSGARMRRELELMLSEGQPATGLEEAAGWGALAAIAAPLSWNAERTAALRTADPSIAKSPLGFALMSAGASQDAAREVAERLRLHGPEAAAVIDLATIESHAEMLRRSGAKPSGVTVLLDRYAPAAVEAFANVHPDERATRIARRYLDEWRFVKPLLSGADLIEIGVPAGPQVNRGLQLLRASRLDGWSEDEGDERALALRFVKSIRDSGMVRAEVEVHNHGF